MANRIPPIEEVVSTLKLVVAPSLGCALGGMLVSVVVLAGVNRVRPFAWRSWLGRIAPFLLIAAVAAVNHFRDQPIPWWPDGKWWHDAIFLFAAALGIELLSTTKLAPWAIGLAAGLAGGVAIAPATRTETAWLIPVVGLGIAVVAGIARLALERSPGNLPAAAMAIWAGAVAMVLLHAKSLGFADLALATSVAGIALAAVAMISKCTVRPVGLTVPLLGLLAFNPQVAESAVPIRLLVATAAIPLLLGIGIVFPSERGRRVAFAVVLIAAIAAIAVAAVVAPMTFDDERW
jgi:hypothetical protein